MHFPCEDFFVGEGRKTSKKTAYLLFFSLLVPVQVRIYQPGRFREKERVELSQTALLGGDDSCDLRTGLALKGAIHLFLFFLKILLQKSSKRCVLVDFFLQNYSSLVPWRRFWMFRVYPSSWTLLNFVQCSSWVLAWQCPRTINLRFFL